MIAIIRIIICGLLLGHTQTQHSISHLPAPTIDTVFNSGAKDIAPCEFDSNECIFNENEFGDYWNENLCDNDINNISPGMSIFVFIFCFHCFLIMSIDCPLFCDFFFFFFCFSFSFVMPRTVKNTQPGRHRAPRLPSHSRGGAPPHLRLDYNRILQAEATMPRTKRKQRIVGPPKAPRYSQATPAVRRKSNDIVRSEEEDDSGDYLRDPSTLPTGAIRGELIRRYDRFSARAVALEEELIRRGGLLYAIKGAIFVGSRVSEILKNDNKKIIWDVFSGTGSVQRGVERLGWEDNCIIVEIDTNHKSPDAPNVVKIKRDILLLTQNDINYYFKYFPANLGWFSPSCKDATSMKNNGYRVRDEDAAQETFNQTLFININLLRLNPNIKYIIENPKSKLFKQWLDDNNIYYIETNYCEYSEIIIINGFEYFTHPYKKPTFLATNIFDLKLKICYNDCDMCINGRHMVVSGWSNLAEHQTTIVKYCEELNRNGVFPDHYRPAKYLTTLKLYEVPVLLIVDILKAAFGMCFS